MKFIPSTIVIVIVLIIGSLCSTLVARELPLLPAALDPKKQTYREQQKLPDLTTPYVSTSPKDLGDGLKVGTLELPGTKEAVAALVANDKAGKFANLDSLLLWKDGKLLFEMYNRRGRVNAPHYAMSITKTLTSITLARAIHLGLLSMDDLDKPIISFMPKIDRSRIQPGVDTITMRDALYMKSGLRFKEKNTALKLAVGNPKQKYFQKLFENTEPITAKSKRFKYTGIDPSLIMMVIDLKVPGTAQEFIAKEVAGKVGASYCWEDQICGLPKCGAGSNFTSRSLIKFGVTVLQGGKFNGEQLMSPEYIQLVLDRKKGDGYFYFFHNRPQTAAKKKTYFISGVGAGGQYIATFPELNLVLVATSHNKGQIQLPLKAALNHLIPLFVK